MDFEWNLDLTGISEFEEKKANELVKQNMIKDVYLENNYIVIEYFFQCQESFISNLSTQNHNVKKMKLPQKLTDIKRIQCKDKINYQCKFHCCIIALAGYLFYQNKKNDYYSNVIDNYDVWDEDYTIENDIVDNYEEATEQNILDIFNKEDLENYKTLIYAINSDVLLSMQIKKTLFTLMKSLINYHKMKDVIDERPSFNYAISENTESVNNVCFGQLKCIKTIKLILEQFEIIKKNSNIKYLNFRELTDEDSLIEPNNYKEDIIVLTNIHYLTNKNLLRGSESSKENALRIKNNIGSFILEHVHDKIFIICDKTINLKEFFQKNQQLAYQFEKITIQDLKKNQVKEIFLHKLNKNENLKLENNFEKRLEKYIEEQYIYSPYKNLEFIDFIYNEGIKNVIETKKEFELSVSNLPKFRNQEIDEFKELNDLVGLYNVKKEIENLQSYLKYKKEKEKMGDKMPELVLHMVFYGNPGTGKTTVARLMAGILFDLEYIRYNKCIECESKDLIANVPGETAIKTSEKIQEAMGGILFIDEAYSISDSPYGAECIATLIKAMEDYRNDLIVILAGYHTEMLQFLEINSGFKSRIAYTLDFEDYSNEELIQMTENLFEKYNVKAENYDVLSKIESIYASEKLKAQKQFGNSRFVRNTVDQILREHAINIETESNDERRRSIITLDDVKLPTS